MIVGVGLGWEWLLEQGQLTSGYVPEESDVPINCFYLLRKGWDFMRFALAHGHSCSSLPVFLRSSSSPPLPPPHWTYQACTPSLRHTISKNFRFAESGLCPQTMPCREELSRPSSPALWVPAFCVFMRKLGLAVMFMWKCIHWIWGACSGSWTEHNVFLWCLITEPFKDESFAQGRTLATNFLTL